ncbi:hypothetical protein N7536_006355 [Penicillium majusculum]|nr:hypothetical protein N7536_006355 [Penicillium majusculum]
MRVFCPLVACASAEKRDKLLGLLKEIAEVTLASEPRTLAYGWFTSAGGNDGIASNCVRGFEVYEDEDAHLQIHRSSDPYKAMRKAMVEDDILTEPLVLDILQPCEVGFMSREKGCVFQGRRGSQVITILEYSPLQEQRADLLQALRQVASHALSYEQHGTLSFWVLEHAAKQDNQDVVVFGRFKDDAAYHAHRSSALVSGLQ